MADSAISVRDVVKQYKVRHEKGRTLKEAFLRQKSYSETIKALNHVSFEVPRGTTLGLIGSNGSGKSTMLKMIAGTSTPNSGEVSVNGRVSALLELGAGFHPDFTGRENVYLDGAIVGLSRRDVDERFDDIVRFSEMEEFIDAPAKTYSSGMYMRLAFSVAVSVDPNILLIDEVLAVGDESFQRKCLKRINEIKEQGTTILFVSHSMDAVRSLCDETVWLDKGKLRVKGTTEKVIDQYMMHVFDHDENRISSEEKTRNATRDEEDSQRWGNRKAVITDFRLLDKDGREKHLFNSGDYMKVQIAYQSKGKVETPIVGLMVRTSDGPVCYGSSTMLLGKAPELLPSEGTVCLEFKKLPFLSGAFTFTAAIQNESGTEVFDYHDRKYPFQVIGGRPNETGMVHLPCRWLDWPVAGS